MTISLEEKKKLLRRFVSEVKTALLQDFHADGFSKDDFAEHPYSNAFDILDEQKKVALETSEEEPKRATSPEE